MKLLRTMPVFVAGCCFAIAPAMAQSQQSQPSQQTDTEHSQSSSSTSKSTTSTSGSSNLSASDQRFLMKAASGGMAEVELGRLATQKGNSQNVKDFGQRMVDDHTKANDRLKQIASQKGVALPSDMSAKDRAMVQRMSKLSGEQFDRAYMQHMNKDHKEDIAEFQKESQSGSDPDIKAFASETLPTLHQHLQMVQSDTHSGHQTSSTSGSGNGSSGSSTSSSSSSTTDKQADTDKDRDHTDRDSTDRDTNRPPKQ